MNTPPDILLTHGYCLAEDEHEREVMMPYPPLGLLYLASHLRAAGFLVEVFDSTFRTFEELAQRLEQNPPRVVGVYANLMTRANAVRIAGLARGKSMVVMGGPEPEPYAQQYLESGADLVVGGEGELALEAICRIVKEAVHVHVQVEGAMPGALALAAEWAQIPGLRYLGEDGALTSTGPGKQIADLSRQPSPARDLIDLQQYLDAWKGRHGFSSVSLITARGCPFTCTWCSHAVFGRSHRRRSVKDVADEVEAILAEYNPDRLWYADDVFTIHRRWTLEYAEELEKRGVHIPFECISRPDCLDEPLVEALAKMGCQRLWLGAESGSQRILDAMKRKTKVEDVCAKTKLLQQHGIEVGMFLMFGFEGEELEDLRATASHLKQAAPDVFLTTVAYPIKGTGYYQEIEDRIIRGEDWAQSSDRKLGVAGRASKRYFDHVTRWLVNDVNGDLLRQRGGSWLQRWRCWVAARVGRLGMLVTAHEKERSRRGPGSFGPGGRGWSRFEEKARLETRSKELLTAENDGHTGASS